MSTTHTVRFVSREPRPNLIPVGMQGDNQAASVVFASDLRGGDTMAFIKLELPDGAQKIPLITSGAGYVWDISRSALKYYGRFEAQQLVQSISGDTIWQSQIFHVEVGRSIGDAPLDESAVLREYAQSAEDSASRSASEAVRSEAAAERAESAAVRSEDIEERMRELAEQLEELQASPGEQGPPGADGAPGEQGPPGADGLPGVDGKSAYEIAVSGGYIGTEEQFSHDLASIGGLADALIVILGS